MHAICMCAGTAAAERKAAAFLLLQSIKPVGSALDTLRKLPKKVRALAPWWGPWTSAEMGECRAVLAAGSMLWWQYWILVSASMHVLHVQHAALSAIAVLLLRVRRSLGLF